MNFFSTIDFHKILEQLTYNAKEPILFNNGFFLFYFCVFLAGYQLLYKNKLHRIVYFILFSLYFFYKACGFYFVLVLISAVVDYNISNWIYTSATMRKKKMLLIFSIVINLALLSYFKYTNFFISIINDISSGHIKPLSLFLPIGISFYTFENLSYTIDVYRGKFKPVQRFLDYLFFLSFFPKLVMGPIVRASDFIPQIRQDIFVSNRDLARGLYLILGGLFKKVVISDYIYANYVQYIFDNPSLYPGIQCLFGVYGYALVIYCDFSGYSDIAIGMAKWMGFDININFDSPYQSSSITEFWRRWHISLSSWLRDYLYISLGGNRKGKIRQYINLMLTMLLGGLWHGASFNFIVWGGMHGVALALDKARLNIVERFPIFRKPDRSAKPVWSAIWKITGVLITFHFVCFCWIFFKASSFKDAGAILTQIFTNFDAKAFSPLVAAYDSVFLVMLLGYIIHFTPDAYQIFAENVLCRVNLIGRVAIVLVFMWILIQVKQSDEIMPIYLQF